MTALAVSSCSHKLRHKNSACAGGVEDVAVAGWTVQRTEDAVLLETAWGCGGKARNVFLSGWAVDKATSDVLRINARSRGCEVCTQAYHEEAMTQKAADAVLGVYKRPDSSYGCNETYCRP